MCWDIFHQAHWDYLVLEGNGFISAKVEEVRMVKVGEKKPHQLSFLFFLLDHFLHRFSASD